MIRYVILAVYFHLGLVLGQVLSNHTLGCGDKSQAILNLTHHLDILPHNAHAVQWTIDMHFPTEAYEMHTLRPALLWEHNKTYEVEYTGSVQEVQWCFAHPGIPGFLQRAQLVIHDTSLDVLRGILITDMQREYGL